MGRTLIRAAWLLADPAAGTISTPAAVLVEHGKVLAIGDRALRMGYGLDPVNLGDAVLMPGLVNAHQHGRGLSQLQLGYPDDHLEPWIARRHSRGAPDPYALTRLAAAQMLRNGVTSTVHANYSYGSGDYAAEAHAALRAYVDAGLRVTFCVGAMDRGFIVYPGQDELGLLATLPEIARVRLSAPRAPPYAGDAAATIALMRELQAEFGQHPLVTLAYGPAGPHWVSDAFLATLAADSVEHGLGLHLHLLESPAQKAAAANLYPEGCVLRMKQLGMLGPHVVFAHCVHVTTEDIALIADAGAVVVHNPGSNLRLANGRAPVSEMLAAGITVALGTDNCALLDDEDLFAELHLADGLMRLSKMAEIGADRARTLLSMLTVNGGKASLSEQVTGRIEEGSEADLIAVSTRRILGPWCDTDTSLLEALAFRARGEDVVLTMVGGKIAQRDGVLQALDIHLLGAEAAETALSHRQASGTGAAETGSALADALNQFHRYRGA
jgi:5-methylthioadenosine/S-adenosylhomocysteine deaminase